ncbi:MAG: PDZ domain-containing protein [Deltaproteobacteria bacterium]|nr:PDZ domain-containing protein [Deltaproteobacteria bacterium]
MAHDASELELLRSLASEWQSLRRALAARPLGERVRALRDATAQLYLVTLRLAPPPRDPPWVASPSPAPAVDLGVWRWSWAADDEGASLGQRDLLDDIAQIDDWMAGLLDASDPAMLLDRLADGLYGAPGQAVADLIPRLHRATASFTERRRAPRARALPSTVFLQDAPVRGYLGLKLDAAPAGVEVVAVHPGGPCAGVLLPGDLILIVDGTALDGLEADRAGILLGGPAGERRALTVYRDGESLQLSVSLAPLPG